MYKCFGAAMLLLNLGMVQAQDEAPAPAQVQAQDEAAAPAQVQAQDEAPAPAQEEEEVKRASINLASPTVQPGQRTYVTILLSNAPDVSVSRLEHWLEFPKSKLTYLSTRAGIAADLARATVKAERQDSEGDTVILHLSVEGGNAIPDGPVAEITFNVGEIPPEDIVLPHRLEASSSTGERVEDVEFSDALLKVSHVLPDAPPAIFSCFFYMH